MKYSAVLFDLDGTLLNTLEDLTDSLNFALTQNGFAAHTQEKVKSFVGNGVELLVQRALPAGKAEAAYQKVLQDFKTHYAANSANKTKPYPRILDMLGALKARGIKLGVVSNKYDSAVKALCPLYFGSLIDIALGEGANIRRKPAPDILLHAAQQLGAAKDKVLFVGDSDVDAQTAQNAGIDFVGVTWGFRTAEDMRPFGAKVFITDPLELIV